MIDYQKAKDNVIEPQIVIDLISRVFKISEQKLKSNSRKREIVTIRKYASYCLVRYCKKYTLLQLSKYLGYYSNGSHATILFHYKDVIKKRLFYKEVANDMAVIEKEFELYINTTLKLEGYTIKDAIENPKILKYYKKESRGNQTLPPPKSIKNMTLKI